MIVNGIEYILRGEHRNPNGFIIIEKVSLSVVENPSDALIKLAQREFSQNFARKYEHTIEPLWRAQVGDHLIHFP